MVPEIAGQCVYPILEAVHGEVWPGLPTSKRLKCDREGRKRHIFIMLPSVSGHATLGFTLLFSGFVF